MKAGPRTIFPTILIGCLLAAISACSGETSTPEQQVRAWVDAMHIAAEEKDRDGIVERISTAYIDRRGNSRDDIEDLLRAYFLRQNSIALLPRIEALEIIGGTAAEVQLTVGMAGTNNSALGITADAYRFDLELQLNGDEWQLISARWGEIGTQLN